MRLSRASIEPGCDRVQQCLRVFASGHERSGDPQPASTLQHQQHALGAAEFGDFVDQKVVQFGRAAQRVQPQAGVDQPLEGLDEVARQRQVSQPLRLGQRTFRRFAQPRGHDLAVDFKLVQVAAAQAFVAHVAHRVEQQAVGVPQRGPGVVVTAVGRQRAAVPPPDVLALAEAGAGEAVLRVQRDAALRDRAAPRRRRRCSSSTLRQRDQHVELEARRSWRGPAQEGAQALRRRRRRALGERPGRLAQSSRSLRVHRLVERGHQRVVRRPLRARVGHVSARERPVQPHAHRQRRAAAARPCARPAAMHWLRPASALRHSPSSAKASDRLPSTTIRPIRVAGALEDLRRLVQQRQALGDVGAAEAQHVQRVGQAVVVSALRAPARRRVAPPRARPRCATGAFARTAMTQ